MKRFVLILASIALLASCTKENTGGDGIGENVASQSICADGCPAQDLVHHPAQDPSYHESGNHEYWQCPHCGSFYADPDARENYEGPIYILPTRVIRGDENLRLLAGDLSSGTKGIITYLFVDRASDTVLIATVLGLVVGVASLEASIIEMSENNDDIEEAVTKLSGKIDKTQEEMKVLEGKVYELQSSVAHTSVLMSSLNTQVDSLYHYIDSLVDRTRAIDRKADKIFEDIEYMDDDFHYRKILDDRHNDLSAITDPCAGAVYGIKERLSEDMACLESAKDYTDSLAVIRMCLMDMNDVIGAWGSDKGNYVTTTCDLVKTYSQMSNRTGETFPAVLETYINRHLIWSHQGYPYRIRNMMYDMAVTGTSYMLARSYISKCAGWERNYADQKCKALDSDFEAMVGLYREGMDRIIQEDSLYRHCLVNGKTFQAKISDACDVVKDYVAGLEAKYGSAAVYDSLETCQQMFFLGDTLSSLTLEDWEYMQAASYASDKSFRNVLPTYEDGGMGFTMDTDKGPDAYSCLVYPYTEKGKLCTFTNAREPGVKTISLYSADGTIHPLENILGTMTCDGTKTQISYNTILYMISMLFPYTGDLL